MIYKYLSEIKYRGGFSCIAWFFLIVNCYCFKENLLYLFMRLTTDESNSDNLSYFLTTDVAEVFVTYMYLSYHVANQITIIFVCSQTFVFLSSGLYAFEYAYFRTITTLVIACWAGFVIIFNTFIFPASWNFFLKFQEFLSLQNSTFYFEAKLIEYLRFYESMYHLCSLLCQITLLFFVFLDLFRINLLIVQRLRKTLYFLFVILSTLITPPEVFYQIIISVCIIITYELTVVQMVLRNELLNLSR